MTINGFLFLGVLIVGTLLGAVVWLQRGVIRDQRARRLAAVDKAADLRQDLDTAKDVEQGLRRELDATLAESDRLRRELEASIAWASKLQGTRLDADGLLSGPAPHRNERRSDRDRERAVWISRMKAAWNGPTRRPPHEHDQGDDDR